MQGCSNFCTYCVVPHTRGPEQSRAEKEIIEEVRNLVDNGVKEITLLGQNVNAYGKDLLDKTSFPGLLGSLNRIDGLKRIRFTTSHPRDFSEELISAMESFQTVCEHIHLPLQSGSDRILRAMNRGYTLLHYLAKIQKLRERVPGVAITADMIVGFPGETDDDFHQTVQALETIRFNQIFSFKFSPRPGTPARTLPDHVAEEIKRDRLAIVHEVQDRVTQEYHKEAEGTTQQVLIEGVRQRTGQAFGRTRTNTIVNINSPKGVCTGDIVQVNILKGLRHSLTGEIP
jgi:tRNA-2-methylthio-N6-dimethylallyladenosine synthase